jgi:hypothetical protein
MVFLSDIQSVSSHAIARNSPVLCVHPVYVFFSFVFDSMDIGSSSMIGSIETQKDPICNCFIQAVIIYSRYRTFFFSSHTVLFWRILKLYRVFTCFVLVHKYL